MPASEPVCDIAAAAPCSPVAILKTTSGLSRCQAFSAASSRRSGCRHALEHAGDRGAGRIVGEIGDVVGHIDVAGIARRHHMAERQAAHHGLRQRHAQRAGLADHADRLLARGWDRRDVHEGHAHVERRIHHADAVRPDDAHVALARDRRQALLLRDAVFLAGLGIARGEDDHAADAGLGAFQDDLLHRLARRGDHGAVGHLRQRGDVGIAALVADPLVARVHRIDPPAVVRQVHQHALAERAGAGGGADHGDAGGMQQARQFGVADRPMFVSFAWRLD